MKIKTPSKSLLELSQEYLQTEFSERAIATVTNHIRYVGEFVSFIGARKIDPFSYQSWIKYAFNKWAPQTANACALGASSRFLNWMERAGHIERSPHKVTKAPLVKTPPPRVPFTPEEFEKLKWAASSDPCMIWAIVCAWETGMAIGDVCLLTWKNVDFDQCTININRLKTHEPCVIPFRREGQCVELLEKKFSEKSTDYPNKPEEGIIYVDSELALLYKRGTTCVQVRFNKSRDKAGISKAKTFHNLRASFCSRLANAGIQTTLACQMSGHKNPAIFAHYVTPDVIRLHEQAAIAWEKQA